MRILAISPHLDDAVLSAGGRLHDLTAQGHEVVVMTVFAGSAFPPYSELAVYLHELWGLTDDPVAARRAEDAAAVARLGATVRHAGLHDALYRPGRTGWKLKEESPVDAVAGEEAKLVVREALETAPDLVLTAAAIGGHIDHVLTRDAVLAECRGAGVAVEVWQDLPYAGEFTEVPRLPHDVRLVDGRSIPVGDAAWRAKCAAVRCYASQLSMLWPEQPDIEVPLTEYARNAGDGDGLAEMFWSVEWAAEPVRH